MIAAHKRAILSFGTFEVDPDSGEIRKSGLRIRLQGQPFRVLTTLLSRPGEVVTREELQQEIWGVNTTVDFERSIASAINKIRDALGDSADNPRYVETLAKRGYRFIAPVAVEIISHDSLESLRFEENPSASVSSPSSAVEAAKTVSPLIPTQIPLPPQAPVQRPQQPLSISVRTICLFFAGMLFVFVFCVLLTYQIWQWPAPYHPPRVEQITQSSVIYSGPPSAENMFSLVTDGPRIYTTVLGQGRTQIASIDLSGGQIQPVTLPDELTWVSIADISHDGSKLIVRSRGSRESEQPLWIVPAAGVSASRVGEVLAHDATWMPGGQSILYASGDDLSVVQLGTGAVTLFAKLPGRAFWPRWSPDARTLRFTLLDPVTHTSSLWTVDAARQHLQRLLFPELKGMSLCCGSWTADGSMYIFQASSTRGSNIWAVGTGFHPHLSQLTDGPLRYMSPLPARADRTVYAVGLQQPASVQRYDPLSHRFIAAPSFLSQAIRIFYSRDGKWVAWTDMSGRLWRAHSDDGSGQLRLTADDMEVFLAQWSPDDKRLILMAREPGATWQIYEVSAAGGDSRLVLADRRNLADPSWSADGRQIVFGREADLMGKENGPHDIYILDLATHQIRSLPGSENLFSPRWSPDGRWICALSLDQTRLLLYDVQRSAWETIFTGSAADPVWSPDSRSIYFHAFGQPNPAILRITLAGAVQSVADLSKRSVLPTVANDFFSGITPDGSPIIEPQIGTGNLYSIELPPAKNRRYGH